MPSQATPEPAASAAPRPFARECDLVMKGGITSGVVYPLAVVEISKAFRLRGIGGASAGAIAAAAAAAAELGRQRHLAQQIPADDAAGFAGLEALPQYLCKTSQDGRGTKLSALFKPSPRLRGVFEVFLAALAARGWRARLGAVVHALIRQFPLAVLLGALLGGGPLWFAALAQPHPWIVGVGLGIAGAASALVVAALTVLVRALLRALAGLRANRFGACSGMPPPGDPAPEETLTVWLTQFLDTLAGQRAACAGEPDPVEQQRPLTFGDLRRHGIDLQMMTTCLTMGRPFRLPFRDDVDVRENNQFFYKQRDFEDLFPERVLAWLVARERPIGPRRSKSGFDGIDFTGMRRLPVPDDLPVVVAVRMSLSFPILLSAIPLYSVDFHRPREGRALEPCWFTDGGVGSNFPIHFFDSALPARPTFGLDLGRAEDHDQGRRVVFPANNNEARLTRWRRFGRGRLLGFLGNVFHVAKDWNHETLSHLPGFRDRIGLVLLSKAEGGINLTMRDALIKDLTEYGREAGREFVRRFGSPAHWAPHMQATPMDWHNQQLVRLRLLLASTAELLRGLELASVGLTGTDADYARFFAPNQPPHTYRFSGLGNLGVDPDGLPYTQAGLALLMFQRLRELARLIDATAATRPHAHPAQGAPKPTPELRTRPRV